MNYIKGILFLLIISTGIREAAGQEVLPGIEQQMEDLTNAEETEIEDDAYLQQLEQLRKNPVNLNRADAETLKEMRILTALQIENFLVYRKLLGNFISIYELQAIPSWDLVTIRKLLPLITINNAIPIKEDIKRRITNGEHILLFRISQLLEKSKGFEGDNSGTKYTGSPQRIFFRYRYSYKNLLQFGITGDKDAGERFFKGAQKMGFDFYSFHLFARQIGNITSLAIGDFTVSMGQGLIHWQGLAFKKSSEVLSIKRQSPVLRPYNSAGEFNFHRGVGITIQRKNIEATGFVSFRALSSNIDIDTMQQSFISSFISSGYHRTASEIENRQNTRQLAAGTSFQYKKGRFHTGTNAIYHLFSLPVKKRDEPYNLYAITGDHWYNISADYSYTYKNVHWFGELAIDKNFQRALVNGLLISVDPRVDLSLLHRDIGQAYQSVAGNAFTESSYPTNEKGLYMGVALRPADRWRLDMYADLYRFPWLKYRVDAPSAGRDYAVQVIYTPNKRVEISTRFRNESKEGNQPGDVMHYPARLTKQNWRMQVNYTINTSITIRQRVEMAWYNRRGENPETGFLQFFDLIYKPLLKPYSCVLRLQNFETDGYNSRLYAYENDVLYSYAVPASYDKGYRYYITVQYGFSKELSAWMRWSQTIYTTKNLIGSEIKLQVRYIL